MSEFYYEARMKIHEDLKEAQEGVYGDFLHPRRLATQIFTTLLAWVMAGNAVFSLLASNYLAFWISLVLCASSALVYKTLTKQEEQKLENTLNIYRRLFKDSLALPGLYGAPHDRVRNDAQADEFYEAFHKVMFTKSKYSGMVSLLVFGGGSVWSAILLASFISQTTQHMFLQVIGSTLLIPGWFMLKKSAAKLRKKIDEQVLAGGFFLAEAGLVFDGKSSSDK